MAKLDVRVAFDELLLSQEKREALVASVLGIPSAKLNQFIKAYNDDLEGVLGELSSTVDVLEILNEGVNN